MEQQDHERTRQKVSQLLAAVPLGRVTTPADIGAAAGIPGAHVDAILSRLDEKERAVVPWHRVVEPAGVIPAGAEAVQQARLLSFEGVEIASGRVSRFDDLRHRFG